MTSETVDYGLINYKSQIYDNLRYSAKHNKIALLNKQEIEQLALKYFGIPEGGPYTAYMDPYSGIIVPKEEWNKIQLEHIITKQVGGTVLFNCLPVMSGINQTKLNHSLLWFYKHYNWGPNVIDRLSNITDLEEYKRILKIKNQLRNREISQDEVNLEDLEKINFLLKNEIKAYDEKIEQINEETRKLKKIRDTLKNE